MINNSEFHSPKEFEIFSFSEFHSYIFGIPLPSFSEFHSLIFKYEKKITEKTLIFGIPLPLGVQNFLIFGIPLPKKF